MPEIFLNYRTGDGEQIAAMLDADLSRRFGSESVFRASKSLRPGRRFQDGLLEHVRDSSAVLAVVGPSWEDSPALHERGDWVRRELSEAFKYGIPVLPVLVGRRTERLRRAALPRALAHLADVHSVRYDTQDSEAGLERIAAALVDLVPDLQPEEEPEAETHAPAPPAGTGDGDVHNTVNGSVGSAVQARDVSGGAGNTHVSHSSGPVHTGSGNIYDRPSHTSVTQSGDGAAYVAGDNHGGIGHGFGAPRPRAERADEERDER